MNPDPQVIKAWLVESNTDLTRGRGSTIPLHVCENQAVALRLAKGAYVMGTDAPIREVTLIKYNGEWYGPIAIKGALETDRHVQKELDLKHAAIKKAKAAGLTDEEIAAISK